MSFPAASSSAWRLPAPLCRARGVLLMDEPFSGLDSRLRDSVRADTLSVLRESRRDGVIVTHDPEEAMRMSDRIVLMRGGRIVQEGTAEELYDRPQSLFVARFFSALNEFGGTVSSGRAVTRVGAISPVKGTREGAAVIVAVRPQGVRAAPPADRRERDGPAASSHGTSSARSSCSMWRLRGWTPIFSPRRAPATDFSRARTCGSASIRATCWSLRRRARPDDRRARLLAGARFAIVRIGGVNIADKRGFWRPIWVVCRFGTGSS